MNTSSFIDLIKEKIELASKRNKLVLSNQAKLYLIKLFAVDLLKNSKIQPSDILDTNIFFDNLPNNEETRRHLKSVGDYYLSVAGYIPEALVNGVVDHTYFLSLGQHSFFRLHQRIKGDSLFKELSFEYMNTVYLMNEVFDSVKLITEDDILKTYNAWMETKHPIFRKRLERYGVKTKIISD